MPHAIYTRYGLKVGAVLAPLVRVLFILFYPIAYPISKILDWMLGKGHVVLLRRAELKTFVDFHGNETGKGGDLTHDETTIIAGALELMEKTAKDAMTLILKDIRITTNKNNKVPTARYQHMPESGQETHVNEPVEKFPNSNQKLCAINFFESLALLRYHEDLQTFNKFSCPSASRWNEIMQ